MSAQQPATGSQTPIILPSAISLIKGRVVSLKIDWFSQLFLPLTATIILLVVSFFFGLLPSPLQTRQLIVDLPKADGLFVARSDNERFNELVASGLQSKERAKSWDLLLTAFESLSTDYSIEPSSDKRAALAKLAQYLQVNFPNEAANASIIVPCREQSCGAKFSYSEELLAIKNGLESSSIGQPAKDTILYNLNNVALAAGSGNKNAQFNSLGSVFQSLRNEWQELQDEDIKKLAEQTLTLMVKTEPTLYQAASKLKTVNLR